LGTSIGLWICIYRRNIFHLWKTINQPESMLTNIYGVGLEFESKMKKKSRKKQQIQENGEIPNPVSNTLRKRPRYRLAWGWMPDTPRAKQLLPT
jgi:predicted nucleotidyltransferase